MLWYIIQPVGYMVMSSFLPLTYCVAWSDAKQSGIQYLWIKHPVRPTIGVLGKAFKVKKEKFMTRISI